jgi:phage FluMu gp28-like protein
LGRRKDLTVAWTLERVDGVLWTREILVLENTPFPEQEAILAERVARARYIAIDSTGMGGPISEHLAKRLGDYKLEAVNFTNDRKRKLFSRAKKAFQSQKVRIPANSKLRDDLASIQRIVTPQGLVKFIAARTRDGHADRATALALALHAAEKQPEGIGLSERSPARVGQNKRGHRPMRTRFSQAWRQSS